MPTLTVTAKPIQQERVRGLQGVPEFAGIQAALELLFALWEQRTREIPPTPEWFLHEAFASQQMRNYQPSKPLQHFLQSLLGPSYCGAESVITYYMVVVFATTLKQMYMGPDAQEEWGRDCRKCLIFWGIREGREEMEVEARKWQRRVLDTWATMPGQSQGPNEVYERGFRLLDTMIARGPRLVKKTKGL
jgi:hypothetical protein